MEIIIFLLGSLYLFIIVYFAVRCAIRPIQPVKEMAIEKNDLIIIDLRDLGLFDNEEVDEILKIFELKGVKKKENVKFEEYLNILTELKNFGYLDSGQLHEKIRHLKEVFGRL